MSVYFERLQAVRNNDAIPSRIQFMVQDLMDMRRAGWKGKPGVGGPKTIAEIHKDVCLALYCTGYHWLIQFK